MAKVISLFREKKHKPRRCDICGDSYRRRNLFEAWINQNPGHVTGWRKAILKVCISCQGRNQSVRALIMVEAQIVQHWRRTKRR